ncbi:Hypothetical predicted protein [Prunus dulcis]|uniref:Uncharacterized protein n=1 Tax=Prunus dulcis TaxID=3755 RepID=A0A5E4G3K4_PRUDU|nr:hypothetical protein L3X38_005675 [Prunus dulcis]VVA34192.1 Hypothetical predicted protein [Prunus dulcis]VVA37405.1 Hypothetical predicted protein [Prunus dulcis]
MNAITKVTPQLVVPPTYGYESRSLLFVCAEVELGSNTFVVTDCDDVPPPLPLAKVCIRLECSKGRIHRGARVVK